MAGPDLSLARVMTLAHDSTLLPRPPRAAALASDLRVGVLRLARRLRAERRDASVTDSQLAVLFLLDREGPLTPGELAAAERVQPPSVTRTAAALEAATLVRRTAHPTDGRQVLLTLTPEGRSEVRETRRRRDAWLARRLAGLTAEERRTVGDAARILARLAAS